MGRAKLGLAFALVLGQLATAAVAIALAAASLVREKGSRRRFDGGGHRVASHVYPYGGRVEGWSAVADNYSIIGLGAVTVILDLVYMYGLLRWRSERAENVKAFTGLAVLGWLVLVGYQAYFYVKVDSSGPGLGDALDVCKLDGPRQSDGAAPDKVLHRECSVILIEFVKFVFVMASAVSISIQSAVLIKTQHVYVQKANPGDDSVLRNINLLNAAQAAYVNQQNQYTAQFNANQLAQNNAQASWPAPASVPQPYYGGSGG